MLALGIDPGTATTGYGLVRENGDGSLTIVDFGVILTPPGLLMEKRLLLLYDRLTEILLLHQPECAAVEKLFFSRNVTTAIAVGQARGVILLTLAQHGLSIGEYTPMEIKQAVAGYGGADKNQVQQMVRALLGLQDIPRPDDAADALAVAICHLHSRHRHDLELAQLRSDVITSSANPQIKQIRKLRERKERQATGLFYLEGLRIVTEAIQQGAAVETLLVAPELLTSEYGQELVQDQIRAGQPMLEVSAEVFQGISLKDGPTGVAAVVHQQWTTLDTIIPQPGHHWVALDSIADPGNLGTIMRTHDAVGGAGLILLDFSTDPYDPTAIRASMGAIFSQHWFAAILLLFQTGKNPIEFACVGTSDHAAVDYQTYHYPDPLVLLMGSERQGLQDHHVAQCDQMVVHSDGRPQRFAQSGCGNRHCPIRDI